MLRTYSQCTVQIVYLAANQGYTYIYVVVRLLKQNTPQRKPWPHNMKTHVHREKKTFPYVPLPHFYNCMATFVSAVFHFSTMNKVYSVPLLISSLRRRAYCHYLVRSWNCMVSPPHDFNHSQRLVCICVRVCALACTGTHARELLHDDEVAGTVTRFITVQLHYWNQPVGGNIS